ncbi:MAG: hypothetical protein HKO65_14335 [Gemmatimonadetes bacterium]|nr:hypothetical protein [Gemmatimonadota bacterium]NNM06265.1 hypothetical protein [Gemmatimonadota bacterium]
MQDSNTQLRLIWPPPGLEACQGILWRKAGQLGFGSTVMVLPFLLATTWSQPFSSLGVFGEAWWLLGLSTVVGLLIILRALAGIFGFFRKTTQAAEHGIDLETALQVGSDHAGDTGALLQGTREFYSLDERKRMRVVQARIWSSIFLLSAATWISVGWLVSVLLATRDVIGPVGAWLLTLGPAAGMLLAVMVSLGYEGTLLTSVRGPFLWNRWNNPGRENAAQLWGKGLQGLRMQRGEATVSGKTAGVVGMASVAAFAFMTVVPMASLAVATSVGPVLATAAVPKFSATKQRAVSAQALERFRVPTDPGISPQQAGEALHVLASVGQGNTENEWFKPAVRTFEEKWIPKGSKENVGVMLQKWPIELFPKAVVGLSPEAEAFLRLVAQHPGLAEFEVIGRAEGIDIMGGRFTLPLPETANALDVPIPRLTPVREAGYAMVARSVVQYLDGDFTGAELTLRTLISAGVLYGREASFLIDTLIGYVLAGYGADALVGFYEATGRQEEADALRWVRETANAMGKAMRISGNSPSAALQQMPARVLDTNEVRGIRWEFFWLLSGISPCINPHQTVFGPGSSDEEFRESARKALVRYPTEGAVLDVLEGGFFDIPKPGGWDGLAARIMGATLGPRAGMCASVLASPYL